MFSYLSVMVWEEDITYNKVIICPTETRDQSLAFVSALYTGYEIVDEQTSEYCLVNSCAMQDTDTMVAKLEVESHCLYITLPIHSDFLSWFDEVVFDDTQAYMLIGELNPYFICLPIYVWQEFQKFMFLNREMLRTELINPVGMPINE